MAFVYFIDTLSGFIPAPTPIYFNLNYSFSLARLKCKGISGTQVFKTVEGALTKVICFDKTGTITDPRVILRKILFVNNNEMGKNIVRDVFEDKY